MTTDQSTTDPDENPDASDNPATETSDDERSDYDGFNEGQGDDVASGGS